MKSKKKYGLYLLGSLGNISVSVMAGLYLLKKGAPHIGLISEYSTFKKLEFIDFDEIIIGGMDVNDVNLNNKYNELILSRIIPSPHPKIPTSYFNKIKSNIKIVKFESQTIATNAVSEVVDNIQSFRGENDVQDIIVINLISTESIIELDKDIENSSLDQLLQKNVSEIGYSMIYSIAAIKAGAGFINFTPNVCTEIKCIHNYALQNKVPIVGKDGKTGETLIKTALAPIFEFRALEVLSWTSFNILGNDDGKALQAPDVKISKLKSKDRALRTILKHSTNLDSKVFIEFVPSIGDWKTAWNNIHFKGFLGVEMSMQFTWLGCDTALAAPMVIDLFRFLTLALKNSEYGNLDYLAFYFKSPDNPNDPQNISIQYENLINHFVK